MKREIKFRAWHIANKQMWQFELLDGNHNRGNGYIGMWPFGENKDTTHDYRGNMSLVDPMKCEIMQFTGLKDKNGKEIYEGDILLSASWGTHSRDKRNTHIVKWGKCGWVSSGYNGSIEVEPDLTVRNDFEIIGNIYENPELIAPGGV